MRKDVEAQFLEEESLEKGMEADKVEKQSVEVVSAIDFIVCKWGNLREDEGI